MPLIGRGGQGRGRHGLGVGGLILATVALIALGTANASQLDLAPAHLSAATAGHPCPGTASMVRANWQSGTNYRSVVLVLPAGCGGMLVQLYLDGTTDRSGTGTTDASGVVFIGMTGNYDRSRTYTARATVNGWDLPTTWTPGGTVIGVISLRSFQNGEYVTAASTNSALIADSATNGTNQQFDLIINNDGTVTLRARSVNRYVTVNGTNSQLYANSTANGTSQKFNLITNPDGTIALQSLKNGRYVCAENAGASPLIANRTWDREWEEFYLVID